jgi:CHAT domain-containing protein
LVVLSACDTGNAEVGAGGGVVSLCQDVEMAGAKASLTSLWPLPSAATVLLMKILYSRLANGAQAAQAVRTAIFN